MIEARGLVRTFRGRGRGEAKEVQAVRGVDVDVAAGEVVGFLGPNGAGKTTTLRMLTTLIDPTAGEATVAGHDLRKDPGAVRRDIGYVAQGHGARGPRLGFRRAGPQPGARREGPGGAARKRRPLRPVKGSRCHTGKR